MQVNSSLLYAVLSVLNHFSHVWLSDPKDCSPPGSSVHGILQARWVGCHALLQGIFPLYGSSFETQSTNTCCSYTRNHMSMWLPGPEVLAISGIVLTGPCSWSGYPFQFWFLCYEVSMKRSGAHKGLHSHAHMLLQCHSHSGTLTTW